MKRLTKIFLVLFILFFLYEKFQLSLQRYFDIDEYAHLHWAYSFFSGERPYRDFFYLFPPFFLFPFYPIFLLFGRSVMAVIASRIFIFAINLLILPVLYLLFRQIRGMMICLTALSVFLFLPLPQDKLLEIRPDLLATMLSITALYFFSLYKEKEKILILIISGFFFSLSLAIVPKTVFFLFPILFVAAYDFYRGLYSRNLRPFFRQYAAFSSGLAVNFLLIFILISAWGKSDLAVYSMTVMASNVTRTLGAKFYMRPDIFFYPNDTYYALSGLSQPMVVNLMIYVLAAAFGIYRFVSSLSHHSRQKSLNEFLISAAFLANFLAFVKIYPLKHLQYLIMVAPFIAFYFADFLWTILSKITVGLKTKYVFVIVLFIYFGFLGLKMFQVKKNWKNEKTLAKINNILASIPADEPVFDLTGETIFYPNGYYFCCLPYGQYQEAISFNLPDLEKEMAARKTRYVHTGEYGRLDVIPNLQAKYIRENFSAIYPDGSMLIRK